MSRLPWTEPGDRFDRDLEEQPEQPDNIIIHPETLHDGTDEDEP